MTDWNNKEEVLEVVKKDGYVLKKASKALRDDKEIVMAAVKQNVDLSKQGNHDLGKPNTLKMLKSATKRFLESF